MGNGLPRLLRWLAVFGMVMAFLDFALGVADWTLPPNQPPSSYYLQGPWVGKRVKDFLNPPSAGPTPRPSPTPGQVAQYGRQELTSLYYRLREPSKWFCLAGILYLFANHQIAHRRSADDSDPNNE